MKRHVALMKGKVVPGVSTNANKNESTREKKNGLIISNNLIVKAQQWYK